MKTFRLTMFHVVMTAFCLVWIYPFLWMVSASFKTQSEFFANGLKLLPNSFQMGNLIRAWNEANFERYFLNSVVISISTILIVLIATATCGYVLGRYTFRGKKLLLGVLVASMFVPMEFAIIPIYDLIKNLGLMNNLLGVILAEAGGAHIIFILLFSTFFSQIPKELEEASIMDGCGFLRTFLRIMLPLSKPIVGSVTIMQFIWSWNSFMIPLILTLSSPNLRPLAVGLYALRGENVVDWTGIAAGGTIAILPIIVIFLFLQRYFVDGIAGAVKG
ncbi:Diacetylchitobiose uptake system permease protein NgcG [Paenibacillus allorhizoplanae]|uniref:Diacetylchitobiose uptake system permease protein NgcG n=1 Tax=Paenibacillus allorhizoplanae TaxID=2905648 RepID=A0ABM9CGC0_9BACL|nr:carbohydrate ABC transporter permease [Paenibacillus allorhizoplanae]CAH1213038.1 Diacetylchitobiose uptake system permease protein NgcG [Paenibacillus allorhizoplanae]